jgi:hypothetical protein
VECDDACDVRLSFDEGVRSPQLGPGDNECRSVASPSIDEEKPADQRETPTACGGSSAMHGALVGRLGRYCDEDLLELNPVARWRDREIPGVGATTASRSPFTNSASMR